MPHNQTTLCAGCCNLAECPCLKACNDGDYCARHGLEFAQAYGLTPDLTWEQRQAVLEAFRPAGGKS